LSADKGEITAHASLGLRSSFACPQICNIPLCVGKCHRRACKWLPSKATHTFQIWSLQLVLTEV